MGDAQNQHHLATTVVAMPEIEPKFELPSIQLKQFVPILIPIITLFTLVFTGAVAFTKVQLESNVNSTQLASVEQRIDRFQLAFDNFRADIEKQNRDRDRFIERVIVQNEEQTSRLNLIVQAIRQLQLDTRSMPSRQQSFPEQVTPPPSSTDIAERGI